MKKLRPFFLAVLLLSCLTGHSQWEVINSGTNKNLVSGCFLNDSTGFIASSDGFIFKTTDSGSHWTQSASLSDGLTCIANSGGDTLYAAGWSLYRSTDLGNTWDYISTIRCTGYDSCLVTDLMFFNSRNGFVICPGHSYCFQLPAFWNVFDNYRVLQSNDFGSSWQENTGGDWTLEHSSKFQKLNNSFAYLVGLYIGSWYHCQPNYYSSSSRRTTDGGYTWSITGLPPVDNPLYSYFQQDTGYFIGYYYNSSMPDSMNIYKTTNGGLSFTNSYTETSNNPVQMLFMSNYDGYLLYKKEIDVTGSGGFGWKPDYYSTGNLNFLYKSPSGFLFCIGLNGTILRKFFIPHTHADTVYRITINSASLDFGPIESGSSKVMSLSFRSTSSLAATFSLSTSGIFTISSDSVNFLGSLSMYLQPFSDTTIFIKAHPVSPGNYHDTLSFSAGNETVGNISLSAACFVGLQGIITQDTIICTDTLRILGNVTVANHVKLEICPGTYVQFFNNTQLIVNGILRANGNASDPVRFGFRQYSPNDYWISIDHPDLTDTSFFLHCRFTGPNTSGFIDVRNGIAVMDSSFLVGGNVGIDIYDANAEAIIENSALTSNTVGVLCWYCRAAKVINNDISGNSQYALWCPGAWNIEIRDNRIHDNSGIGIQGSGNSTIQGNKIYNNAGGIDFGLGDGSSQTRIFNNEIYNNVSGSVGGISCNVHDLTSYIIQNLIYNNTTTQNPGAGICLNRGYSTVSVLPVYILNNTICNNKIYSPYKGSELYAYSESAGMNLLVQNNIFYNIVHPDNVISWDGILSTDIENNCFTQTGVPGNHNVDADPKLKAPTSFEGSGTIPGSVDWSLQPTSPCINAGVLFYPWLMEPYDIAGNPRVKENIIDIGAYEFPYPSSINNQDPHHLVSIYPNPTMGLLNITVHKPYPVEIILQDPLSRIVFQKVFSGIISLDTRDWKAGIYLYRVRDDQGIIGKGKIVVYH
jgi:parallel beta-helix repeat protein